MRGKAFLFLITAGVCMLCVSGEMISPEANKAFMDKQSGEAKDDGIVKLAPFVIEGTSRAMLRLNFRHHMIWAGLKSLTFTEVTASWAKAGIKVGDLVTKIDGKPIDGMRLKHDFAVLLKEKFAPLKAEKASEVPIVFEIQSPDSNTTRSVNVILKSSTSFTVYSNGF